MCLPWLDLTGDPQGDKTNGGGWWMAEVLLTSVPTIYQFAPTVEHYKVCIANRVRSGNRTDFWRLISPGCGCFVEMVSTPFTRQSLFQKIDNTHERPTKYALEQAIYMHQDDVLYRVWNVVGSDHSQQRQTIRTCIELNSTLLII